MPRCAEPTCSRWRPSLGPRLTAGLLLNGRWFCSPECLAPSVHRDVCGTFGASTTVPALAARPAARVGAILRSMGAVSAATLDAALASQRQSGRKLGAELQVQRLVGADVVVRALAAQAGMSYLTTLDLARVRRGAGGLAGHTVRALGVVPFEADATTERLHVACAAPPPKAALHALAALTSWRVEPYIVDDAVFDAALAAYPASVTDDQTLDSRDAGVVATRVARLAGERGAVTLKRASCPGFVWLRVEDAARADAHAADTAPADDLFWRTPQEEPCLVASTPR